MTLIEIELMFYKAAASATQISINKDQQSREEFKRREALALWWWHRLAQERSKNLKSQ